MDLPIPDWMPPAWKTYLADNRNSPQPADDIHRDLFASDLMPLQRANELSRMIALIRREVPEPRVFMEIGADRCTTLYHWLRAFPSIRKMVAIEIRGVPMAESFNRAFPDVQFLWLGESSYDRATVTKVQQWLGEDQVEALFLDGDKSHFDTDFDRYLPVMSPRGIVMFHDVFDNNSPMQEAYRSRSSGYNRRGVVLDTGECDQLKAALLSGLLTTEQLTGHQVWLNHWLHTSCGFGWLLTGSKAG